VVYSVGSGAASTMKHRRGLKIYSDAATIKTETAFAIMT